MTLARNCGCLPALPKAAFATVFAYVPDYLGKWPEGCGCGKLYKENGWFSLRTSAFLWKSCSLSAPGGPPAPLGHLRGVARPEFHYAKEQFTIANLHLFVKSCAFPLGLPRTVRLGSMPPGGFLRVYTWFWGDLGLRGPETTSLWPSFGCEVTCFLGPAGAGWPKTRHFGHLRGGQ